MSEREAPPPRRGMWVEAAGRELRPAELRSPSGVAPVKPAPWEKRYIPVYFWVGGIAAGSWIAATLEDTAGDGDRATIRAGRYLAAGGVLAGTGLLIADLGRPERFLNMLRVFRGTSAMSVGSWVLSAFGGVSGLAALLQAAEDGLLGERPRLAAWSRGAPGRLLHAAGLPLALFVGSYTGTLLSATNVPAWAERRRLLAPLFAASALSSGSAAVSAATHLSGNGSGSAGASRRLARAEAIGACAELALTVADRLSVRRLPSARDEEPDLRGARGAMVVLGMAAPLALALIEQRESARPSLGRTLLGAGLAIAGALALRLLVTEEGERSARTTADTWRYADRERLR